jgi:membrane-associated phospholipid phosphatase
MRALPPPRLSPVSDEALYPNRIGSFAKGLPHDALGEVNPYAYEALLHAVGTGRGADFEDVPMGGPAKLHNPLGGLAFGLVGPDSHQMTVPTPPAFASAEAAAEMGELYWQALARDVPFAAYAADATVAAAAADLTGFGDYRGRVTGRVSPETLFRADIPGVTSGPFVSQFLLKDLPTGAGVAAQAIRTALSGDHLTTYDDWLAAQDGAVPAAAAIRVYDPTPRYVRNGRDLAEAVHWDWPGQGVHQAALIAFGFGTVSLAGVFAEGGGVPMAPSNPYRASRTQTGFATFGLPDAAHLVAVATHAALKAAWYQKWFVHRRLRPEEFGGRIHHATTRSAAYPVHADLLERSVVLGEIGHRFGSTLLPQAYPEGCPIHPAYPSGHATWAGAAVTVLKAFFDEEAVIANPVVAADDGLSVVPFTGPDADRLTLGGELNKLAWNIAVGRTFAGIHWRTDAAEGLHLGEAVALGILSDVRETYGEEFRGFALTGFDERRIAV